MVTILTAGNSEGERRCDARCHEAMEPDCDCVCGGRYHGSGRYAVERITGDLLAGRLGEGLKAAAIEAMGAIQPTLGQQET